MKKVKLLVLLGLVALFLNACTKSTTADTTTEGNWVTRSTLDGAARSFGVAFTVGNYAYIGTGLDGNNKLLSDFWRYDLSNNSWKQVASIPVPRHSAVAFSIGTKGYVGTGTDGQSNYYSDFYEYDPSADTWTKKADFAGAARSRAVAFSIGTKGYITCGWNGSYFKDMYAYNPATDSWANDVSLGGDKRVGAVAFVYNNEGYVVGGTNSSGQASVDFWKFNQASDSWKQLRNISTSTDSAFDDDYTDIVRTNAVAVVLNSYAYLSTGQSVDGGTYTNNTWCYIFATDLWERRTAYERTSRKGAVAFVLDNRAFVGTGINTGAPFDNFDEFIPSQEYNAND